MIMLGALCELDGFPIDTTDIKNVIQDIFPESKLDMNYRALDLGKTLLQEAAQ